MPEKNIRFHLRCLGLEEQDFVISNIDSLPGLVGLRAMVSRERLQQGNLEKCVLFDLWKGEDGGVPNVQDPSGRTLEDNELHALLFATLCLRKELEAELRRRQEYRAKVGEEIEGLTGSDGMDNG